MAGWTRAAVRAAAEELNSADISHVRSVLVSTFSAGNVHAIESMMHLLDQAMKLSPVLLPVIRSVLSGTPVPATCQAIIARWEQLRLVPPPAAPPVRGYFYWTKMARLAAEVVKKPPPPPPLIVAGIDQKRAACAHCHEPFPLLFSDAANDWTLLGAIAHGGALWHVDCTPAAVEKWALS